MNQTIQQKLIDKVDELFPKIKPNGGNQGRGEAIVLVGVAVSEYEQEIERTKQRAESIVIDLINRTKLGRRKMQSGIAKAIKQEMSETGKKKLRADMGKRSHDIDMTIKAYKKVLEHLQGVES